MAFKKVEKELTNTLMTLFSIDKLNLQMTGVFAYKIGYLSILYNPLYNVILDQKLQVLPLNGQSESKKQEELDPKFLQQAEKEVHLKREIY